MSDEEIDNRWEALNKRWDENERRFAAERYAERAVLVRTVADAFSNVSAAALANKNVETLGSALAAVAVDALIADGVVFARMGPV